MKLSPCGSVYVVVVTLLASSCIYKEIPVNLNCTNSDLSVTLVSKADATNCKSINGQLAVTGVGGTGPYDYKIGDGIYQTNPVFASLGAGTYTITVKDAKGCKSILEVTIAATGSTLATSFTSSPDTQCQTPHDGTITVTPSGGASPYLVKIDDGVFGLVTSFTSLISGSHTVIVKDGADCELVLNVIVSRGDTGISYAGQIQPILNAACNFPSCHGAGNGGRDWTVFSNVQSKAASIKLRTTNRTMPIGSGPSLTDLQIQQIACWVDDGAKSN